MLEIKNVTKKFKDFSAVENINLKLDNGVYGLLAPNGAGKTTLIKMIVTLLRPTEGEILYNGEDIFALDEKYRELIGFLPQKFGYYKEDTPIQFLTYIAALNGIKKKDALKKCDELLSLVGLEDVKNKKMKKFSGGMLQRVGIANALMNDPEILILDEPTAGLDPMERVRFRNIISNLSKDRIVILSTHIVSDIERVANNIILIKDKHILMCDTPENVCALAKDRIYQTTVDERDYEDFANQYSVLTQKVEGSNIVVRIKSEEPLEFERVTPSLEDVFLYVYGEAFI